MLVSEIGERSSVVDGIIGDFGATKGGEISAGAELLADVFS